MGRRVSIIAGARNIFILIMFTLLASCSVPTATSASANIPSGPPPKVIYYHSYKEMCNTTWETADKKMKVVFAPQEKRVQLIVNGVEFFLNPNSFVYDEGVFTMESEVQDEYTSAPWTVGLVLSPESKTLADYYLLSGGSVVQGSRGILNRI